MATGLFNLKQVNQAISQGAWSGYIAPRWVEYLVVAGGGSGNQYSGAGGAGGLLTGIVTVAAGTSYTVTIGAGGAGASNRNSRINNGANSVFGNITALGGGCGGADLSGSTNSINEGASGGSGGGGTYNPAGGAVGGQGTSGQGNTGGKGSSVGGSGGGGGAGTVGLNETTSVGGNGGAGIASAISGTVVTYAGGGGGSFNAAGATGGTGGVGGGGNGGSTTIAPTSGSANTGGGGGGDYQGGAGGAGGSGIVVVRYPGNVQFYTGGTVTYSNGYIVHNFTANGTLAPTTPTVVSEYQISRSLRFNQPDGSYVARTFPSAGNRKIWTWSAWVKRSALSTTQQIFSSRPTGSPYALIYFASDQFNYADTSLTLTTTQVFRDVSAWYHIVIATDTTQATASNRLKFYINGVQVTAFSTATYPAQNYETQINTATQHNLSGAAPYGAEYFSGYMTEVNFIDGQALTATSFGYVNPITGIWSPAKYVGGYGTNGFYLNFSDNSNTTAATLGKDYSGNGNNWTPNNFSVTAGAGNDSLVDSPTSYGTDTGVGGEVRGNYATYNPLVITYVFPTYSNGNLDLSASGNWCGAVGTIGINSGKWYWEVVCGNGDAFIGICGSNAVLETLNPQNINGTIVYYGGNGEKRIDGTSSSYGASYTTETIGVALNIDGGTVTFYKNNASQGSINLSSSTLNGLTIFPFFVKNTSTMTVNFGQRPFAYTAPSGFKALCTQNLPTPTIGATTATLAGKYFNPVLYTGTGANQSITDVGFQPDWTWIKCRSAAEWHSLFDAVRGAGYDLRSNSTNAEVYAIDTLSSFNSTGFSLGVDSAGYGVNTSGRTYVAWNWKANGSGSTNTAGSITSTVSANTTSGFSVVTWTGNGANATIGHGLGVAPKMIIHKFRSRVSDWYVYNASLGANKYMVLNSNVAVDTSTAIWQNTSPTSTVFSIGDGINVGGDTIVAYCFAEVAGYSRFGTYAGNNSVDGQFVNTGFRPAYVMIKTTAAGDGWTIQDSTRFPNNAITDILAANSPNSEATFGSSFNIDFLSNGFKIRNASTAMNLSGSTYIFMAFAQNPFKTSLAR